MQEDRIALCSYLITGQVQEEAETGSVVMFAVPKEYSDRGMNENVLHVSARHSRAQGYGWDTKRKSSCVIETVKNSNFYRWACMTASLIQQAPKQTAGQQSTCAVRLHCMHFFGMAYTSVHQVLQTCNGCV
jgi:hypothetical protein